MKNLKKLKTASIKATVISIMTGIALSLSSVHIVAEVAYAIALFSIISYAFIQDKIEKIERENKYKSIKN